MLGAVIPFAIFLCVSPCAALPESVRDVRETLERGLVAHWGFDEGEGDISHDGSPNRIDARVRGAEWTEGRYGRALRFDGKDDYVDCSGDAALRIGGSLTVTAWVKTDLRGQQYVISKHGWSIYLGGDPMLVHFETRNAADDAWAPDLDSRLPVPVGEWFFVAAVNDPERQRQEIYLDGLLVNARSRSEPIGGVETANLLIGRYAASESQWFSGVIDEVRIYNRALSPDEIRALYVSEPVSETRRMILTPRLAFSSGKVVADLDWRAMLPLQEGAAIELFLSRAETDAILLRSWLSPLPVCGRAELEIAMRDQPAGEYRLEAIMVGRGGTPVSGEPCVAKFTWPERPAWLGSNEGRTDRVLPPWTPIRVEKGGTVRIGVRGRRYEFSDIPLVEKIETQDRSILARPLRLEATTDSGPVSWRYGRIGIVDESPAKVSLEQQAQSDAIVLRVATSVEYDGTMAVRLRLRARRQVTLTGLHLDIPLSPRNARYIYSYPYGLCDFFTYPGEKRPGSLPGRGRVEGCLVPILWLGDDDVGLAWFADDTMGGSRDPDVRRATQISCEATEVLVRLQLLDGPVALGASAGDANGGEFEYAFGLLATPVKPVEKTCWDYRIATSPWYGGDYRMLTDEIEGVPALDYLAGKGVRTLLLGNWTRILAYTKPVGHEDEFRRLVNEAHQRGMKVIPYLGFQMSELAPEWPSFGDEVVGLRSIPDRTARGVDHYPGEPEQFVNRVCYRSAMQDFLVDGIARLMDEYGIDGVYLDSVAYPSPCVNRLHGCGRLRPDGSVVGTFPMFAIRETLKRIYAVVKTRKADGIVDVHGPMNVPALAWATSNWNGEGLPKADDVPVLVQLPLDHFRAEFMGRPQGIATEFLHYALLGHTSGGYRRAWALALLHDVPVRLASGAPEDIRLASSLWRLFEDFPRAEAEWLPYWKNSDRLAVRPDGAYASLYLHPLRGLLVVASNLKGPGTDVEIELNAQSLGLGGRLVAEDALSGEPVALEGATLRLTIPCLDWKVIRVRPAR